MVSKGISVYVGVAEEDFQGILLQNLILFRLGPSQMVSKGISGYVGVEEKYFQHFFDREELQRFL